MIGFSRADKRSKLPKWIGAEMAESNTNLSTDMAVSMGKRFFKMMAQPQEDIIGLSLWDEKQVQSQNVEKKDIVMV